MFHTQKNLKN